MTSAEGLAPEVRLTLEEAATGLVYLSEIDAPFEWVELPSPNLTVQGIATSLTAEASLVQERSVQRFFRNHIERVDPADSVAVSLVPRFEGLRDRILHLLPGATVFRVGESDVTYLILGQVHPDYVVGLQVKALET